MLIYPYTCTNKQELEVKEKFVDHILTSALWQLWKTGNGCLTPAYHYTEITVVYLSVPSCPNRSPEASRPQQKKLHFSAKPESDSTPRGSPTQPETVLAPD